MADVVLIDDDDDIRLLATLTLEMDGKTVSSASNGGEGLELVRATAADGHRPVVVLDVQMPEVDGWEVLTQLRADPATAAVPVVLCTVRAGVLDREKGFGLGADAFQVKPFDLDQLLSTVDELAAMSEVELLVRRSVVSTYIAGDEERAI